MAAGSRVEVLGELNTYVEDLVKRLTENTTNQLFQATPKLTGFAESNWLPTIGQPASRPAGSKQAVSRSEQIGGIATVNSQYTLPKIVYITNVVPYIVLLNQGSSRKAPEPFVYSSIALAIRNTLS